MNEFKDWLNKQPPVTRTLLLSSVAVTLAAAFGVVPGRYFLWDWFSCWRHLQVWRPLTSLVFFGGLDLSFLMNLYFLYRYSYDLETHPTFVGRTPDYAYFFCLCQTIFLIAGTFLPFRRFSGALVMAVVYLWSQFNKDTVVTFMFGMKFKAIYFPWVLAAFSFVTSGGRFPFMDLLGIVAAHFYYFIEFLYPAANHGKKLFSTPQFLYAMFASQRKSAKTPQTSSNKPRVGTLSSVKSSPAVVSTTSSSTPATSPGTHFWGRGNRLGE